MLSIFRSLVTFRSRSLSVTPVVLGRWGIQYDPMVIDCKVFQANEDHCGCCVVDKTAEVVAVIGEANNTMKSLDGDENIEEYLLPYIV